jgi:hypothetical protein
MEHGPLMCHDLRRWGQLEKDLAAAEADRCDFGRQDESWKWTLDVVQQWSAMHWFEMIYDNETIHDIIIYIY